MTDTPNIDEPVTALDHAAAALAWADGTRSNHNALLTTFDDREHSLMAIVIADAARVQAHAALAFALGSLPSVEVAEAPSGHVRVFITQPIPRKPLDGEGKARRSDEPKRIQMVKALRSYPMADGMSLSLKEGVDIADRCPCVVGPYLPEAARSLVRDLAAANVIAEILEV